MKTLTITMSDEAFRVVRQAVQVRGIAGNLGGAVDAVTVRIVEAIERGEASLELKTREEREAEAAS